MKFCGYTVRRRGRPLTICQEAVILRCTDCGNEYCAEHIKAPARCGPRLWHPPEALEDLPTSWRLARYRGLRGIVLHVLRKVRATWGEADSVRDRLAHRGAIGSFAYRKGTRGICRWCGTAALGKTGKKLAWHPTCLGYYSAAKAVTNVFIDGDWLTPRQDCSCGKPSSEVDHRLALGIAARTDIRTYVRAFLPDNLQWLCQKCHNEKTQRDRAEMRRLDNELKARAYSSVAKVGAELPPRVDNYQSGG